MPEYHINQIMPDNKRALRQMDVLFYEIYQTSVGPITIAADNSFITHIHFGDRGSLFLSQPLPAVRRATALTERAWEELCEYLSGNRHQFDLPLRPCGSAFQQKIWKLLLTIPYGETITYGELAAKAGNPKSCRAVGMANHYNPIAILIPCHRVIGKNNRLTGYAGGLELKRKLLELEGALH